MSDPSTLIMLSEECNTATNLHVRGLSAHVLGICLTSLTANFPAGNAMRIALKSQKKASISSRAVWEVGCDRGAIGMR